jgi:putative exosortase-associated protein (TIGR04073 family)
MKKKYFVFLAMMLVSNIFISQAYALDTRSLSVSKTPLNKLIRGLVNVATCIVELPASIVEVSRDKGFVKGATLGVADGLVTTVVRLGTGLFDAVTFVIPPYDKPLLKPEYAIESAKEKIAITEW